MHLFGKNDVCADGRADVVANNGGFAVAFSEFTIIDFGKFDGVICAGDFIDNFIAAKFDDFDEWFCLTRFVDCLFDV